MYVVPLSYKLLGAAGHAARGTQSQCGKYYGEAGVASAHCKACTGWIPCGYVKPTIVTLAPYLSGHSTASHEHLQCLERS